MVSLPPHNSARDLPPGIFCNCTKCGPSPPPITLQPLPPTPPKSKQAPWPPKIRTTPSPGLKARRRASDEPKPSPILPSPRPTSMQVEDRRHARDVPDRRPSHEALSTRATEDQGPSVNNFGIVQQYVPYVAPKPHRPGRPDQIVDVRKYETIETFDPDPLPPQPMYLHPKEMSKKSFSIRTEPESATSLGSFREAIAEGKKAFVSTLSKRRESEDKRRSLIQVMRRDSDQASRRDSESDTWCPSDFDSPPPTTSAKAVSLLGHHDRRHTRRPSEVAEEMILTPPPPRPFPGATSKAAALLGIGSPEPLPKKKFKLGVASVASPPRHNVRRRTEPTGWSGAGATARRMSQYELALSLEKEGVMDEDEDGDLVLSASPPRPVASVPTHEEEATVEARPDQSFAPVTARLSIHGATEDVVESALQRQPTLKGRTPPPPISVERVPPKSGYPEVVQEEKTPSIYDNDRTPRPSPPLGPQQSHDEPRLMTHILAKYRWIEPPIPVGTGIAGARESTSTTTSGTYTETSSGSQESHSTCTSGTTGTRDSYSSYTTVSGSESEQSCDSSATEPSTESRHPLAESQHNVNHDQQSQPITTVHTQSHGLMRNASTATSRHTRNASTSTTMTSYSTSSVMTSATATLRAAARGTFARGVATTLAAVQDAPDEPSANSGSSSIRGVSPIPGPAVVDTPTADAKHAQLLDPAPWHNYNIRYDQHGCEIPNLTPGSLSLARPPPPPAEPEEPASWFEPATPVAPIRRKGTFRGHWVKRAQ